MITIKNLTKYYGNKKALDNLSFEVSNNTLLAIIGENGAGKSTLINILSGFVLKSSGEIKISKDLSIGVMPQDSMLEERMNCKNFLKLMIKLNGYKGKEAAEESFRLLARVGLESEANKKIRKLSHGMRKRLQIAQALIGNPDMLIFDEPVSGLDPKMARNIKNLIVEVSKDKAMIYCTHNLSEVEELCKEVLILKKGCGIKQLKLKDLRKKNKIIIEYDEPPRRVLEDLKKKKYINNSALKNNNLELTFKNKSDENKIMGLLLKTNFKTIKKGVTLESEFFESTK